MWSILTVVQMERDESLTKSVDLKGKDTDTRRKMIKALASNDVKFLDHVADLLGDSTFLVKLGAYKELEKIKVSH
jgi:hypothetical protein